MACHTILAFAHSWPIWNTKLQQSMWPIYCLASGPRHRRNFHRKEIMNHKLKHIHLIQKTSCDPTKLFTMFFSDMRKFPSGKDYAIHSKYLRLNHTFKHIHLIYKISLWHHTFKHIHHIQKISYDPTQHIQSSSTMYIISCARKLCQTMWPTRRLDLSYIRYHDLIVPE